jgi:hypothetical protein
MPSTSPSRPCWPPRRSITTWSPRAAHPGRTGRRNRRRARNASLCGCSPVTVPKPCIPYLALETLQQLAGGDAEKGRQGDQALHQGRRQGSAQGDVQDGHFDLYVLHRGADLRSVGLQKANGRQVLHRHLDAGRRDQASSRSWKRRSACTARLSATIRCWRRCSTPAASTLTGCVAKSTCGRPR